jgi:hypothetical protein
MTLKGREGEGGNEWIKRGKERNCRMSWRKKRCDVEEELLLLEFHLMQKTKAGVYFESLRCVSTALYSLTESFGGNESFAWERKRVKNVMRFKEQDFKMVESL